MMHLARLRAATATSREPLARHPLGTLRSLRGNLAESVEAFSAHDAVRTRRKRSERVDSVNETIIVDRDQHMERMASVRIDRRVLKEISSLKLGRTKLWQDQKRADQRRRTVAQQQTNNTVLLGRTGVGMYHDWDRLNREELPEVAVLGHSNCGKSALLNALAGTHARHGPAAVSARAGWTADLGFYRMRPKLPPKIRFAIAPPPSDSLEDADEEGDDGPSAREVERQRARAVGALGLVLVDTPGFGFAVGDRSQLTAWGELLADYLDHSSRLRLALLLIDSTRGLCVPSRGSARHRRAHRSPCALTHTYCLCGTGARRMLVCCAAFENPAFRESTAGSPKPLGPSPQATLLLPSHLPGAPKPY